MRLLLLFMFCGSAFAQPLPGEELPTPYRPPHLVNGFRIYTPDYPGWFLPDPDYIPEVILISKVSDGNVLKTICGTVTDLADCVLVTGKVVRIYVLPNIRNCQLLHALKHAAGWKHYFDNADCY